MDNKCVYCSWEESGNLPDYHESLIQEVTPYQTIISVNVKSSYFGKVDEDTYKFEAMNADYKDEYPYHSVYVDGETGILWSFMTDHVGLNAFEFHKKINYCPMCGRRLGGSDAD